MYDVAVSSRDTQTSTAHDSSPQPARGDYLFVCIEGKRPMARGARFELSTASEVVIGSGSARRCLRESSWHLELPDHRVSRTHCRLQRRFGTWSVTDCGSKNGTYVNGTRRETAKLQDGDVLRVGSTVLILRAGIAAGYGDLDLQNAPGSPGMMTLNPELEEKLEQAAKVAASDVPILITGPTGAGKELLAAALHKRLDRSGAFVAVNCGSLPEELAESELFGHRKGAFSGSQGDHAGLFAKAQDGTLFLDELGEMPLAIQAKLLRAVQERSVRPVGDTATRSIDVRIVAATNADLDGMLADRRFRADLHSRLAGFVIDLPPAAKRREDFGAFVAHALHKSGHDLEVSSQALDALFAHPWPGGARALAHAVIAGAALTSEGPIRKLPLPATPAPDAGPEAPPQRAWSVGDRAIREEIRALSLACAGNLAEVARRMGKDRKQIRRWVERLALRDEVEQHRDGS